MERWVLLHFFAGTGGGMVVEALNETFDNEKMSNSQRQGVNWKGRERYKKEEGKKETNKMERRSG